MDTVSIIDKHFEEGGSISVFLLYFFNSQEFNNYKIIVLVINQQAFYDLSLSSVSFFQIL